MQNEILKVLRTMGLPNLLAAEMTVGLTTMHADVFAARLAEGLSGYILPSDCVCTCGRECYCACDTEIPAVCIVCAREDCCCA